MGLVTWTFEEIDGSSLGLYPLRLTKPKTDSAIVRIPSISKLRSFSMKGTSDMWNYRWRLYDFLLDY